MKTVIFWGDFDDRASQLKAKALSLLSWDIAKKTLANLFAPQPNESEVGANEVGLDSSLVVFIHESVFKENNSDLITYAQALSRVSIVVLFYETAPASELMNWLKENTFVDHLLPCKAPATDEWISKLLNPLQQIARGITFDSQSSMIFENVEHMIVQHSSDFELIYARLMDYLLRLKCFGGFDVIIKTAASELLTNAFYNGKKILATGLPFETDRRKKFGLDQGEAVRFCFGVENNYLWLVAEDCFGTLDRPTLIKALHRAAIERTAKMDGSGGAGLGLLMLYNWASEMNFYIKKGVSTTVACRFKVTPRNLIFDAESSALHIFSITAD